MIVTGLLHPIVSEYFVKVKFLVCAFLIEEQLLTDMLLYNLFILYSLLLEYNFAIEIAYLIFSGYFRKVKVFFAVDLEWGKPSR